MALTVPSPDDLYEFWGEESADVDEDRAKLLLELSANLFWLATGLDDDPADPRLANLVKTAILDMAIYVYITRDDINSDYSPFQSERIGSYSYSKQYNKMSRAASINEATGVPLFDRVVADILDGLAYGEGVVVGGEHVYREYYVPLAAETYGAYNPYPGGGRRFGNADQDTGLYN